MNQTWKNGKKPNFGSDFSPFLPKFGAQNVFSWAWPLLDAMHCYKLSLYAISRRTNEPNLRKWKKTSFGLDFGPVGPNLGPKFFLSWILPLLDVIHCCKLSFYAISRKANEPNSRKWQKT